MNQMHLLRHICVMPHCTQCRLLQLPGPQLNEMGKATWTVSSSELSRAYRKLSILVHPDKNPGSTAREAFEQLKQAYNELKDPDRLVCAGDVMLCTGDVCRGCNALYRCFAQMITQPGGAQVGQVRVCCIPAKGR
jgi:hypothetical protein